MSSKPPGALLLLLIGQTAEQGVPMSVVVWIVLAFILGVIFGRISARSSRNGAVQPVQVASPAFAATAGPGVPASNVQTSVSTTIDAPNTVSSADTAALLTSLQGSYTVMLVDRGPNLINTIKAVREVTHLGLKEAKDLTESAPCKLLQVASLDEGKRIIQRFQGIASVRMDGTSSEASTQLSPELQRLLTEFAQKAAAQVVKPS